MSYMHLPARIALVPLFLIAAANAAETASSGLSKKSPFQLRDGPAAPAASANETIEFAGVSSIVGKKADLIFYDKTAKKSHWIAQGETKEGIAVVDYDEVREEAVVKVNGVQKTLPLRKVAAPAAAGRTAANASGGFNIPTAMPLPAPIAYQAPVSNPPPLPAPAATNVTPAPPVTAPPAPAPGSAAETQVKQETEARMLVSDLLEIGMAQRRAYEEAQRKAAGGNAQNATAPEGPKVVPAQP
jgi:hypothetical protein